MKQDYYATQDTTIEGTPVAAGTKIATLETLDGLPVGRIIRGIANNIFSNKAPQPTSSPAAVNKAPADQAK